MTNFFTGSSTTFNNNAFIPGSNTNINTNNNSPAVPPPTPISNGIDALFNVFTEAFGDNPLVKFKNVADLNDEGESVKQKFFIA